MICGEFNCFTINLSYKDKFYEINCFRNAQLQMETLEPNHKPSFVYLFNLETFFGHLPKISPPTPVQYCQMIWCLETD